MNFGYIKVGTCSPSIKVADIDYNVKSIKQGIDIAIENKIRVLVFPELSITGCTCGDLFFSDTLLSGAKRALLEIANYSKDKNILIFIGLPFKQGGLIYNVCAGICDGKVLGLVPKTHTEIDNEFFGDRYFAKANDEISFVSLCGEKEIPFGKNIIFADNNIENLKIACEINEDLNALIPSSTINVINGARIIVNPSANCEFSSNSKSHRELIKSYSAKTISAYIYANAGEGESTTDCVFSGHSVIAENGEVLSESKPFSFGLISAEIDLSSLDYQRSKHFKNNIKMQAEFVNASFSLDIDKDEFSRTYDKTPFLKDGEQQLLIDIAAHGLKKRIEHINAKKLVIGISGGLDSTLALIIASRTMQLLNKSSKDIISITMPCFGTSKRTFDNSVILSKAFNTTLKKIDITKAVQRHLKDIGHSEDEHDASYENSQARERTQVLMDYANSVGGIVIGTGDLSELALGWATYNGDHMSMYAVNGSIPKTLVRYLVEFTAKNSKGKLKAVLFDILDTPVSPELLPTENEKISQKTEDLVGPYILHDFFLYNMLKNGYGPKKLFAIAVNSFKGEFDKQTILKWLKTFIRRFFSQQFKRSCLPDGVKVSEISLSPRTGFKMPSDALSTLWLKELEEV